MTVPTYDKFIEPLLRYLALHADGAHAREVHEAAAATLGLSDTDRQELLPSGTQPIYKNRAGWAHDRLKRAGLSKSPRRGFWLLTDSGRDFAQGHPAPLSPQDVERLAIGYMDVRLRPPTEGGAAAHDSAAAEQTMATLPAGAVASPDDRLAEALGEIRQTVTAEVLEVLSTVSPSFFETIVLDLLHRMGYGASRADFSAWAEPGMAASTA